MLGGRVDVSEFAFNAVVISLISLISRGVVYTTSDVADEGLGLTAKLVAGLTSTEAVTSAVAVGVVAGLITAFEVDFI